MSQGDRVRLTIRADDVERRVEGIVLGFYYYEEGTEVLVRFDDADVVRVVAEASLEVARAA